MQIDLYGVLGGTTDMTADEIKKAYRSKMKQIHPDKNGGAIHPDHNKIQHAYDVLGSEDRRRKYDDTGEDEEDKDADAEAMNMIASMLVAVLDTSPADINALSSLVEMVGRAKHENSSNVTAANNARKKLVRFNEKLTVKGKAAFLAGVITGKIGYIDQQIKAFDDQAAVIAAAESILIDVEYDYADKVDLSSHLASMINQSPFTGTGYGR